LVVYYDIAVFVASDSSLVEAQIVGVRAAADREQQMRTGDLRPAARALGRHGDLVPSPDHAGA